MSSTMSFLLVFMFFIGSAENKYLKKAKFITTLAEESLDSDIERYRHKRAIFGAEFRFFRRYFSDIHLLSEFCDELQPNGTIRNWQRLQANSYTHAIRRSANYYAFRASCGKNVTYQLLQVRAIIKHRNETAFQYYGGPDDTHNFTINEWKKVLKKIEDGENQISGGLNGRKKRGIPFLIATLPLLEDLGISAAALLWAFLRQRSSTHTWSHPCDILNGRTTTDSTLRGMTC